MSDVERGFHPPVANAILISLTDPDHRNVIPKESFKKIFRFSFLDAEDGTSVDEALKVNEQQAADIAWALSMALREGHDVIVHCHAGIARSGAVAEVGVMMGFYDTGRYRQPNVRLKTMMINALGWGYSNKEEI